MDAVKFINEKERMCSSIHCHNCGLSYDNNGYKITCSGFIADHPEEAVEIIENWSKNSITKKENKMDAKEFLLKAREICKTTHFCKTCNMYIHVKGREICPFELRYFDDIDTDEEYEVLIDEIINNVLNESERLKHKKGNMELLKTVFPNIKVESFEGLCPSLFDTKFDCPILYLSCDECKDCYWNGSKLQESKLWEKSE